MTRMILMSVTTLSCAALLFGCPTLDTLDEEALWKTAFDDAFVDEDGDGVCDTCGFVDLDADGTCDNYVDDNGDGICDACGFIDEDGDGVSDNFLDEDGDGVCDHRPEGTQQGSGNYAYAHGQGSGLAHGWHQ